MYVQTQHLVSSIYTKTQVPYVTLEELEKISQSIDTSTKWEAFARQAPNAEDIHEFICLRVRLQI